MNLRTYDGLKAAVKDYLGRGDMDGLIPTFISLAELRMNRELRLRCMERTAECAISAGMARVALPNKRVDSDRAEDWDVFMEMRDLVWLANPPVNMRYLPPDEYAVRAARGGMPKQYTIIGNELALCPVPDGDGVLRLTYYTELPPLSSLRVSNQVLLLYPDLYLYAALVESAPYSRGSAPLELWSEFYAAAKKRVQEQENRARYTANMTMRPARRV